MPALAAAQFERLVACFSRMTFKNFRDKAQVIALISSMGCFVSGFWVAHFYLSRLSAILFLLSLVVAFIFAVLSFPRWRSLVALTIVALSIWWSGGRAFAAYHSTKPSPDGKYKLVTFSMPMLFAFPGQGSDASGYVQLQDSSGKVLNEGYVDMVQIVYDAEWDGHEVQIGRGDGSYTWSLPQ
jgi:hypothetical protein